MQVYREHGTDAWGKLVVKSLGDINMKFYTSSFDESDALYPWNGVFLSSVAPRIE